MRRPGAPHCRGSPTACANRETITGRQGRAEELDLLKEVFGEDTGLASAKLIAQQWKDTAEYLRLRANAAGMAIPSRRIELATDAQQHPGSRSRCD